MYHWYGVMMVMSGIQIIISAAQPISNDGVLIDEENKKMRDLIERAASLPYVLIKIIVDYADRNPLNYYAFPLHDTNDYFYTHRCPESEVAFVGVLNPRDGYLRKDEWVVAKQSTGTSHYCCGFSSDKNDVAMEMYGSGLSLYITEQWGWIDHRVSKGFKKSNAEEFLKDYGIDPQVVFFFTYILEHCCIQLVDVHLPCYRDALQKSTVLYREDVTWCHMGKTMHKIWKTFSRECTKNQNHHQYRIMNRYVEAYITSNIPRVLKRTASDSHLQPLLYRSKTSYKGSKKRKQ